MISFDWRSADPQFVHFWTRTRWYRSQVEVICSGTSSTMQNLAQDDLKSFSLALPPIDEQIHIVKYLREYEQFFENLLKQIEQSVVLLRERRSALITAAVTGQIDVRGEVV